MAFRKIIHYLKETTDLNRFYTAEDYSNYNGYDNTYSNGDNSGNNGGGNGNGNSNSNGNGTNCRFINTATAQGYLEAAGSGNPTMVNGERKDQFFPVGIESPVVHMGMSIEKHIQSPSASTAT